MEIGVIGKGNLGKRISEVYKSIDCDLLNEDSIRKAVDGFDVVINCAGKYGLEWCEVHPIESYNVNVFGLEKLLKVFRGKIIHISCDCIYNGTLGFYSEDDNRSFLPLNRLANTKYFQEMQILQKKKDYLIIRTSELYDINTPNIKRVFNRIKDDRPVSGSQDIFFTPTYIPHLVTAIKELVDRNLDGIINVAGKDYCNEERFNQMFCDEYGYEHFKRAGLTDRNKKIRQPKRTGLDTQKAENINIPIFGLEEGLSDLWMKLLNRQ